MKAFPQISELPVLTGDEITQVRLDPFGVLFLFMGAGLYVQHLLEQIEPDGTVWPYDCQSKSKSPVVFQRLLSKKITGVDREDLRMSLTFDDGSRLIIFSDIGPYEAGHFNTEEGILVF